jgi:hypothetical protein
VPSRRARPNDATLSCVKRRTWLVLGGFGAAVLSLGGVTLALWRPGWAEGRLTPAGREFFATIARTVLAGMLPAAGTPAHEAAMRGHLERLEATVGGMPAVVQAEIAELTALLLHPAGRYALAGLSTDWTRADPSTLQATLQGLRESPQQMRQQIYHALRNLTNGAYFSDRTTWAAIGYPGPRPI